MWYVIYVQDYIDGDPTKYYFQGQNKGWTPNKNSAKKFMSYRMAKETADEMLANVERA
jgi:hypothetical protein